MLTLRRSHLLPKKSWNVYAPANIERVKRDEAAAAAREAEEERRMQEVDAERRIAILRGQELPSSPEPDEVPETSRRREGTHHDAPHHGRDRKRRRLAGENDTDRDIRLAREDTGPKSLGAEQVSSAVTARRKAAREAPITDQAGHISLFPEEQARKATKNAEAETEAAKKKRELEDQYTMRFSNAAGKNGLENPWYAASGGPSLEAADQRQSEGGELGKNVWGQVDPRRKHREQLRTTTSDPLAFMQKAQVQLRDAERDKRRWAEAKQRELRALEIEEHRSSKRRSSHRSSRHDDLDLDGFSLDKSDGHGARHDRDYEHRSSRHRHRRSRSRERDYSAVQHMSHRNGRDR